MGHNTLEDCRQGTRRRHSLSLVSQEPRLVQHGIISDPIICVCGEASVMHGPRLTGHPESPGGILLPPSSWHWLQFWSRQPAQLPGWSDFHSSTRSLSESGRSFSAGSPPQGHECLPVSVFRPHLLLRPFWRRFPLVHRWFSLWVSGSWLPLLGWEYSFGEAHSESCW